MAKSLYEHLQDAVDDYNMWASRNTQFPFSFASMRGILYNKMVPHLQVIGIRKNGHNSYRSRGWRLTVDDLLCTFHHNYLVSLQFSEEAHLGSEKISLAKDLNIAAKMLTFKNYPASEYYQIEDIVNQVKNFKINLL